MSEKWWGCQIKVRWIWEWHTWMLFFSLVEQKIRADGSLRQSAIGNKLGFIRVDWKTIFGAYGESHLLNFSMWSGTNEAHFLETCVLLLVIAIVPHSGTPWCLYDASLTWGYKKKCGWYKYKPQVKTWSVTNIYCKHLLAANRLTVQKCWVMPHWGNSLGLSHTHWNWFSPKLQNFSYLNDLQVNLPNRFKRYERDHLTDRWVIPDSLILETRLRKLNATCFWWNILLGFWYLIRIFDRSSRESRGKREDA